MTNEPPAFTEIVTAVEDLCDSLRELRRDEPEKFYGHPVEDLYKSLENALWDFYRSKMEQDNGSAPQN